MKNSHRDSPKAQRLRAEQVAFRANFDAPFDFAAYHADETDDRDTDAHLFLLHTKTRIIGMLVLRSLDYVGKYTWEEYGQREQRRLSKAKPIYSSCMIWIHERHRRKGLATLLVSAAAEFFGTDTSALGWYTPFTEAGEALARSLCPTSFYVAK